MSNYKQFSSIFDGLRAACGTYKVDKKQLNGSKTTGKAGVVRETRTKELWEGHLSGKGQSVGIIPINEDNNCKWGCVDIDQYNFDHKTLIEKIRKLKLPLVVCRSKSGGAHVFVFTSDWVSAKNIQEVLRHVASLLGYGESEIFPKQVKLNLERGDVGNFLNMPYYDHEDGLRYAIKDDGTAATLEEFFDMYKEYVCTPEQLSAIMMEEDKFQPIENGPPCLQVLCKKKFPRAVVTMGYLILVYILEKLFLIPGKQKY